MKILSLALILLCFSQAEAVKEKKSEKTNVNKEVKFKQNISTEDINKCYNIIKSFSHHIKINNFAGKLENGPSPFFDLDINFHHRINISYESQYIDPKERQIMNLFFEINGFYKFIYKKLWESLNNDVTSMQIKKSYQVSVSSVDSSIIEDQASLTVDSYEDSNNEDQSESSLTNSLLTNNRSDVDDDVGTGGEGYNSGDNMSINSGNNQVLPNSVSEQSITIEYVYSKKMYYCLRYLALMLHNNKLLNIFTDENIGQLNHKYFTTHIREFVLMEKLIEFYDHTEEDSRIMMLCSTTYYSFTTACYIHCLKIMEKIYRLSNSEQLDLITFEIVYDDIAINKAKQELDKHLDYFVEGLLRSYEMLETYESKYIQLLQEKNSLSETSMINQSPLKILKEWLNNKTALNTKERRIFGRQCIDFLKENWQKKSIKSVEWLILDQDFKDILDTEKVIKDLVLKALKGYEDYVPNLIKFLNTNEVDDI